jgi:hypothetical protein
MEDKLKKTTGADGKLVSPILPEEIKNFLIDIDGTICDDVPMKSQKEWRPVIYIQMRSKLVISGTMKDILLHFSLAGLRSIEKSQPNGSMKMGSNSMVY